MKMREFGKLGILGSAFGVGCMRFPTQTVDGETKVNVDEAVRIIRTAIDHGCNYLDTAYVYHQQTSESIVGMALKDGYREKTMVATKLPTWLCKEKADLPRFFEEQRTRLDVDQIDFYLVHALNRTQWERMKTLGVKEFLDDLKAQGKIRYAGFSFHDDYEAFHDILIDYQWDMCQIQLNILDVEHQAGLKGLRLAGSLGIPVVIMEGLLGGSLVNAPEQVQALYDAFPIKRSSVEWAFRWLCNMEEVACVLSGVSSMEQTMDNLRIFDTVEVGCMSEEELALIDKVRQAYEARRKIGCTGCAYCMPCPGGVDIPGVFKLWNERFKLNRPLAGNQPYADMKAEGKTVDHCLDCGACEEVCPQHLPIREKLRCANEDMDG